MSAIVTTCPECCTGNLSIQAVTLTGTRNNEAFEVTAEGVRCDHCGYETILNSQSGEFTRAVSDAYRTKHGLLTGDEIRVLRIRLGLSQVEFAEYLGVGSASVKRWESGQIQDKAMDNLIRLKAQPEQALHNYQALEARLPAYYGTPLVVFVDEDVEISTCSELRFSAHQPDWTIREIDPNQLSEERELVAA